MQKFLGHYKHVFLDLEKFKLQLSLKIKMFLFRNDTCKKNHFIITLKMSNIH